MSVAVKGKTIMSQSARVAIRAFQAREFPERHTSTEKSFLARVNGRPNDEDIAIPLHIGWGKKDTNRWILHGKGLVLSKPGSVIFRNELEDTLFSTAKQMGEEIEGDQYAFNARGLVDEKGQFDKYISHDIVEHSKWPKDLVPLVTMANPESDVMEEMLTACTNELGFSRHVFLFDNRAIGASAFGRSRFDFVTDCKSAARVLSGMLSVAPKSDRLASFNLMHCAYRDVDLPAIDTYAAFTNKLVVSRGQFEPKEMLEVMIGMAAKPLLKERACLVLRGSVVREASGEVKLILGGDEKVSDRLQAAHHFIWGSEGVTRAWDGVLQADRSVVPLSGTPRTLLAQPTQIVFAKSTGATKDTVKEVMEKSLLVSNEVGVSFPLFEKLVKKYKVKLSFE